MTQYASSNNADPTATIMAPLLLIVPNNVSGRDLIMARR